MLSTVIKEHNEDMEVQVKKCECAKGTLCCHETPHKHIHAFISLCYKVPGINIRNVD
ncbi:hypothetical protein [Chitinophaga sp. YR627]|uniref:hypothetical protein n=1 Tax=Chitinophaga sp. YR627 TaxID=1881041 RepID=UPI0015A5B00B|nr:hypothetical protein [Chitinophaga sp. YR627]